MSFKRFLKRTLVALLLLGGVLVIVLGYWYTKLTADIAPSGIQKPDSLDAKEADRKLGIFEQAMQAARPGFIRLSEVEINSYVAAHYFTDPQGKPAPAATASGTQLLRCLADLTKRDLVWHSWVVKDFHGVRLPMVWTRSFRLLCGRGQWVFDTTSMSLGDVDIPRRYWPQIERWLGDADQVFTTKSNWVRVLPALELHPHEITQTPELRLYTYADTNALRRAKP